MRTDRHMDEVILPSAAYRVTHVPKEETILRPILLVFLIIIIRPTCARVKLPQAVRFLSRVLCITAHCVD